jgi:hypothetical protein
MPPHHGSGISDAVGSKSWDKPSLALFRDLHRLRNTINYNPVAATRSQQSTHSAETQENASFRYFQISQRMEHELLRVIDQSGIDEKILTSKLRYNEVTKRWQLDDLRKGLTDIAHEVGDAASRLKQELFDLRVEMALMHNQYPKNSNVYEGSIEKSGFIVGDVNEAMNSVVKRQHGLEHLLKDKDSMIDCLKAQLHSATVSAQAAMDSAHANSEQTKYDIRILNADVERFCREATQLREQLQQRDRRVAELEEAAATKAQGFHVHHLSSMVLLKAEVEDLKRHLRAREKVLEDLAASKLGVETEAAVERERLNKCIKVIRGEVLLILSRKACTMSQSHH